MWNILSQWMVTAILLGPTMRSNGASSQGFQVVLGVRWFSTTEVGDSGGYLTREFKSQVWEPMLQRVAIHVYENFETIELIKIMIGIGMA